MRNFDRARFGLKVGDTVKPTAEYEDFFHKSFYATVLFFQGKVAILQKDNGERAQIDSYWLEKSESSERPQKGKKEATKASMRFVGAWRWNNKKNDWVKGKS